MPRKYPWLNILLTALLGAVFGWLYNFAVGTTDELAISIIIGIFTLLLPSLLAGLIIVLIINLFKKQKLPLFNNTAQLGFYLALVLFCLRAGVLLVVAMS